MHVNGVTHTNHKGIEKIVRLPLAPRRRFVRRQARARLTIPDDAVLHRNEGCVRLYLLLFLPAYRPARPSDWTNEVSPRVNLANVDNKERHQLLSAGKED